MKKSMKHLIFMMLFLVLTVFAGRPSAVYADTESNPITSIVVTYVGGAKDVGDTVKKSDFKVVGTTKNKRTETITDFTLVNNELTKKSTSIRLEYTNAKGKTFHRGCSVKADKVVKSIRAAYTGSEKLVGENVSASDFTVTYTTYEGKTGTLNYADYTLSTDVLSKASTHIKIAYVNSAGKTIRTSLNVKAKDYLVSISATQKNTKCYARQYVDPGIVKVIGTYKSGKTKTLNKKVLAFKEGATVQLASTGKLTGSGVEAKASTYTITTVNEKGETISCPVTLKGLDDPIRKITIHRVTEKESPKTFETISKAQFDNYFTMTVTYKSKTVKEKSFKSSDVHIFNGTNEITSYTLPAQIETLVAKYNGAEAKFRFDYKPQYTSGVVVSFANVDKSIYVEGAKSLQIYGSEAPTNIVTFVTKSGNISLDNIAKTMTVKANGKTLTRDSGTNGYTLSVKNNTIVIKLTIDNPDINGKQITGSFTFANKYDYITAITNVSYTGSTKAGTDIRNGKNGACDYSQIKLSIKTRTGLTKTDTMNNFVSPYNVKIEKESGSTYGLKAGTTCSYRISSATDSKIFRKFLVTCSN